MDTEDLSIIAFNYSRDEDFEKIKFKWNGKYGKEFEDANDAYRVRLCEYLFPIIEKVSIGLIRDLYLEFAKTSEATFGAYFKMNLLGQELLRRGGVTYLMDYLEGASYTVDTFAASSKIQISQELAKQILSYIEDRLKTTTDERERRLLDDIGLTRFTWLARDR